MGWETAQGVGGGWWVVGGAWRTVLGAGWVGKEQGKKQGRSHASKQQAGRPAEWPVARVVEFIPSAMHAAITPYYRTTITYIVHTNT